MSGLKAGTEIDQSVAYATLAIYSRHCQPGWRETAAGRLVMPTGTQGAEDYQRIIAPHSWDVRDKLSYVGRLYPRPTGDCWQLFNVTRSVKALPSSEKQIHFFIHQQQSNDGLDPNEFLHLRTTDGNGHNQPVLVVHSGKRIQQPDSGSRSSGTASRHRRDTKASAAGSPANIIGDPIRDSADCGRRDHVLNLTLWYGEHAILIPMQMNMYRCAGHCRFPIQSTIRSTNHARFESRMEGENKAKGVQPVLENTGACCVPSALSHFSYLHFYERHNSFVIKTVPDVIAQQCSCL